MNNTPPRMIPVEVAVTTADPDKYGLDALLVRSLVDSEADPYWTIETIPNFGRAARTVALRTAAMLHLTRTHPEHRVARISYASQRSEEMMVETDDFDIRVYRAELRLIAKSE